MMQTGAFSHTLVQTLQQEHRFLQQILPQGILSLPKNILKYICAKAIFSNRQSIFGTQQVQWLLKENNTEHGNKPLFFRIKSSTNEDHLLLADIIFVAHDDDLLLQLQDVLQSFQPHEKCVATILQSTRNQVEKWRDKWTEKIGAVLKPAAEFLAFDNSLPADEMQLWLVLWENVAADETADIHINADIALTNAVQDMYFESMVHVIRRIISLRTNLDEGKIEAETGLSSIFKMVFAREQGVPLDDVYDPETMLGCTDSQLAANNLLADMQKAFNVNFDDVEMQQIATIKDLAGRIISKKS